MLGSIGRRPLVTSSHGAGVPLKQVLVVAGPLCGGRSYMPQRLTYLFLSSLVLLLAACGGGHQDPRADHSLHSVFGPATLIDGDALSSQGVAGVLGVRSTQPFEEGAELSFAITGPDGPVGNAPRVTNPTERVSSDYLTTPLEVEGFTTYVPGEYLIEVYIDDELIDSITYDLSEVAAGLDAPDFTAEATLQGVTLTFDEEIPALLTRAYLRNVTDEGDLVLTGAAQGPTDTLELALTPDFPLNRSDDYILTILADSATLANSAEGEGSAPHIPARFLRYSQNLQGDDFDEKVELYYNTFTVSFPRDYDEATYDAGEPMYVGLAVLSLPLGAPDPTENPWAMFKLERPGYGLYTGMTWTEGDRFIVAQMALKPAASFEEVGGDLYFTFDGTEYIYGPVPVSASASGEPLDDLPSLTIDAPTTTSLHLEWEAVEGASHYAVFIVDMDPSVEPSPMVFLTDATQLDVSSAAQFPIDTDSDEYGGILLASEAHPFIPGASNMAGSIGDGTFPPP